MQSPYFVRIDQTSHRAISSQARHGWPTSWSLAHSLMNGSMVSSRFNKYRSHSFLCSALTLVLLAVWGVLSNGGPTQAAAEPCSQPSFLTAKGVHRFTSPNGIRSGDFNGDHHVDLVILTGDDIAILRGDGAGNFTTPTIFPAGPHFSFTNMAVADVNADGKLDVVRSAYEDSSLTKGQLFTLLGDGAGSLGAPNSIQTDGHLRDMAFADFNGDGKLDLAASAGFSVSVMQGDGTGSFGGEVRYQPAGVVNTAAIGVADFNGDGKADLATARSNTGKVALLLNDGNGLFSTVREFATSVLPTNLLASDFNGDGKVDVVTAGSHGASENHISVLFGDGAGNLATPINTPSDSTFFLSSGDFNGDDKPDVVRSTGVGTFGILLSDGTGHFAAPREFNLGGIAFPPDAVVGDFNEDGKLDLATQDVTLAFGDGVGGLLAPRSLRAGNDPSSAAAGDFNEDGRPDLVVTNHSSSDVSLLIQDETGGYEPATSVPVDPLPSFIAVTDFNGDGHLDFVTANNRVNLGDNKILGTVSIRLGDGTGNFAPLRNFPSGHAPNSLVVVDVNQDGKLDLVVANVGTVLVSEVIIVFPASVSILLGDGAGGFASPVALSNAQVPNLGDSALISIAAGDLNNDNKVDLVLAYRTYIQVLLGDGTGQFGAPVTHVSPTVINSLVIGDFDRDTKLDIATLSEFGPNDSNTVSIRFGDGAGNLGAAHDIVIATNPLHLAAGDFNLDDNLDLIASNGGSVSIILGDGAGGFGAPTAFNVSAKSTAVADLNADGKLDIVAIPSGVETRYVTILLNSCGGLVTPTPTPTPTPAATPTPTPSPNPSPGPVLITEDGSNHAIAHESVTFTRGPFAVRTRLSFNPDQRTRIILFASNLELLPGEDASDVTAKAEDAQGNVIPLIVENVGKVPGFDWLTQVTIKLPDELETKGEVQVSITLRGRVSNKGLVTIKVGTSP